MYSNPADDFTILVAGCGPVTEQSVDMIKAWNLQCPHPLVSM